MSALEQYTAVMEEREEHDPIERLRFFLSIALAGQDWIDVEQFIDDVLQQLAAKDAELEEESQLRERLSYILSRTAIALKGPNDELSLHSWHDLPEKTAELKQQLAEREKQVVMLREAAKLAHTALEDWLVCDLDEDQCEFATKKVNEALDATQDLSGLVLCDAEPIGYLCQGFAYKIKQRYMRDGTEIPNQTPFYKARKP